MKLCKIIAPISTCLGAFYWGLCCLGTGLLLCSSQDSTPNIYCNHIYLLYTYAYKVYYVRYIIYFLTKLFKKDIHTSFNQTECSSSTSLIMFFPILVSPPPNHQLILSKCERYNMFPSFQNDFTTLHQSELEFRMKISWITIWCTIL